MSEESVYDRLFGPETDLGKRCSRLASRYIEYSKKSGFSWEEQKTIIAYTKTLLRRYSKGNFNNMPTPKQATDLNEDVDLFLKIDSKVKREVTKSPERLRAEADKIERRSRRKINKLRAQADEIEAYIAEYPQIVEDE